MADLQPHESRHRALLRKNAAECTVLLKKDGAFPLNWPCSIALYGTGPDTRCLEAQAPGTVTRAAPNGTDCGQNHLQIGPNKQKRLQRSENRIQ